MIELKEGGSNDADDNNVGIGDGLIRYGGVYTCVSARRGRKRSSKAPHALHGPKRPNEILKSRIDVLSVYACSLDCCREDRVDGKLPIPLTQSPWPALRIGRMVQ